jgi:iron complex outermembrane receptor protein
MRRYSRALRGLFVGGLALLGDRAGAQSVSDLQAMSIGQLETLDVTSVTKTREDLSDAPAAIYVITQEAIARSGAATLPEILRLAPNLQVDQISASRYIITARGFSGNIADQNFANQLLVLIDGRSVYTPLYSGVYWDMQDVPPSDIERIEVISGPGATLWGANAVNGVINITTKKSSQTQGGLVELTAGNLEQSATLQYGGRASDTLAYRLYLRDYWGSDTELASGQSAHDHWSRPQGGFRLDWTPSAVDDVTFQGDAYTGWEAQPGAPNENITGHNLQAAWSHAWADGSLLQVLTYYDHTSRGTPGNGTYQLDQFDAEAQYSFDLGDTNKMVVGGGLRVSPYRIYGTNALFFVPPSRTLDLADAFAQDSIALTPTLTAILGLKLESDPYSGLEPLPTARLSWKASDGMLLWAAASRAIRSPTPFDVDVAERVGSLVALNGDRDFQSAKLNAYEIGTRLSLDTSVSFSLSAFYNDYGDLRSIEVVSGPAFLNLAWGNELEGTTYGFEAWADYQALSWWHLSASFDELSEHFKFKQAATATDIGTSQLGDDPSQSASLRSSMNLSKDFGFDADLRYVGRLPDPRVPAYAELNSNVWWNVSDTTRLSLNGFNLLHASHLEFPSTEANAVPRSYSVGLQWRF